MQTISELNEFLAALPTNSRGHLKPLSLQDKVIIGRAIKNIKDKQAVIKGTKLSYKQVDEYSRVANYNKSMVIDPPDKTEEPQKRKTEDEQTEQKRKTEEPQKRNTEQYSKLHCDVPADLYLQFKIKCIKEGKTITAVINNFIADFVRSEGR
jgi:hypothetical protein